MSTSTLLRVAAGELTAVQSCMNRYGGLVWSLARRFSKDRAEAEDAVQEIFLDVWKSADRYDPAVSSEATFIVMIAHRRLIDRQRKQRRSPVTDPLSPEMLETLGVSSEDGTLRGELALAERALATLRPEQRKVLLMAACHGMSHEQIARATGLPLGTVKTHARRGLAKVREALAVESADSGPVTPDGRKPEESP